MFLTAEAAEQFENTKAIIVRRRVSIFLEMCLFFAFVKRTNERKQYYR